MESEILSTNEPVVFSNAIASEFDLEVIEPTEESTEISSESSEIASDPAEQESEFISNDDILTNETFNNGVAYLADTIDPYSVNDEVLYQDYPVMYALNDLELPDYAVLYQVNGFDVIFPTDYADNILVVDGLLINLGSSYTAGVQMDGYSVNNYLSSEITIPTYHSATWYQYLQSYGQPYRIVDRYVNNNGYISSSTRSSVSVEWSGGNPWQGFTFDRIAIYLILLLLVIMFVFRKGR